MTTEIVTSAKKVATIIDLERFKIYSTSLYGEFLAISTDSHLVISQINLVDSPPHHQHPEPSIDSNPAQSTDPSQESIKSIEFPENISSRVSVVTWITEEVVVVGFESGLLIGYSIIPSSTLLGSKMTELFQFKGEDSMVSSIRLFEERGIQKVWILYEGGLLVMISVLDMLNGKFQESIGFRLTGQSACNDLIFYYRLNTNLNYWEDFDITFQTYHLRVFVVGYESTISIYDIDMIAVQQEIQILVEKEKAASTSYFKSFYSLYSAAVGSGSSSNTANSASSSNALQVEEKVKTWNRTRLVTLVPTLQFIDAKRRIIRLSMDPFHTLIATADTLGRVELYDINSDCFIRLWKGVRDASLGWHIDEEDTTALFTVANVPGHSHSGHSSQSGQNSSQYRQEGSSGLEINESKMSEIARTSLQLVIYAPLLGLISIYKMKNGPCLRVIPIGMNCRLVPMSSSFIQNDRSIQTAVPVAYDPESQCFTTVTLNSKFQSDTELSYLADLIDSLELDFEQHVTSDPYSPHTPHTPSSSVPGLETPRSESEGLGVRHSDMRDSMREAVQRGRKFRQPLHFLNNELQKYLNLLAGRLPNGGHPANGSSNKLTIQEIERLENKILQLLQKETSLLSLLQMLQMIENFELNGFNLSNQTQQTSPPTNNNKTGAEKARSPRQASQRLNQSTNYPWIRININNKRRFSIEFHKAMTESLQNRFKIEEATLKAKTPHIYRRINDEIDTRNKLLSVFTNLGEIDSHTTNLNHPGNVRRPSFGSSSTSTTNPPANVQNTSLQNLSISALKEDASHACKANSFRSESLCWVLRSLKKAEHKQKGNHSKGSSPKAITAGNSSHTNEAYRHGSINDRLALSPKPPLYNQALRSRNSTAATLPVNTSTPVASGLTTAGVGFESPMKSGSFHSLSNHRRSSFSLTPPNLSISSETTLRKLIDNNTRNSFTSPTVDVVVSLLSAVDTDNHGITTTSGNNIINSNSNNTVPIESAVMNFSIFRALHIYDGNRELYLMLNLIRSWLESERGNLSYDIYEDCIKQGQSIYQYFQSSIAVKAQNFSEIITLLQQSTTAAPSSTTTTGTATAASSGFMNSVFPVSYRSNMIMNPISSSTTTTTATPSIFLSKTAGATTFPAVESPFNLRIQTETNPIAPPSAELYYHLHPNMIYPLLGLIFKSLVLGDLTALHSFYNAMKYESSAFSGIEGLRDFLPCFLEYISHQSLIIVVQDLLGRNISTSPVQRLLRDHLLTFQDLLSRYKQYKTKFSTNHPTPTKEEEKAAMEDSGLEYAELRLMDQLRLDVLNEFSTQEITLQQIDLNHHIPSFDEFVRHIFRPAWKYCRIHTELEMTISFASIIVDTLHTVNDQIERRTYGADNMKKTITCWENVIRQLRVILLLKSRIYSEKIPSFYTIHALTTGDLSLYQILAYDTLEFTVRVEQSQEHEERCRELYKKRAAGGGGAGSIEMMSVHDLTTLAAVKESGKGTADVLVAWGPIADKRWRDILTLVINEDTAEEEEDRLLYAQMIMDTPPPSNYPPSFSSSSATVANANNNNNTTDKEKNRGKSKRRKPLLLYFPDHNHRIFLGAYRSIILAQRWNEKIDSMEKLVLVMEHLFEIPMIWRSMVALEIYSVYLFPIIIVLINLEEDKDTAMNRYSITNTRKEQLLNIMAEKSLLESFIRCSVEILNYILEIAASSQAISNSATTSSSTLDAITNELLLSTTAGMNNNNNYHNPSSSSTTSSSENSIVYDLQEFRNYYQYYYLSDDFLTNNDEIYKDEDNFQMIWPKKYDMKLVLLHYEYFFHQKYSSSASFSSTSQSPSTSPPPPPSLHGGSPSPTPFGGGTSSNQGNGNNSHTTAGRVKHQYYIWNNKYQLFYHISVLYVLQLRFHCGLRGLKPSQLLGSHLLDLINELSYYDDYVNQQIDWKKMRMNRYYDYQMINTRLEFLEQCFLRCDAIATFSIKIIYNLSKLWDFEADIIYLLHLKSLLSKGDIDNEMEGVIAKCADVNLVSDFLIQLLRIKMGLLILQIEKYAVFSPLIVLFDPEAMDWAKLSIRSLQQPTAAPSAAASSPSSFSANSNPSSSSNPSTSFSLSNSYSTSLTSLSPLLTNDSPLLMNSTLSSSSYYGMSGGSNYPPAYANGPPGSSASSNNGFVKIILKDVLLIKRIISQVHHLVTSLPAKDRSSATSSSAEGNNNNNNLMNNTQYFCDKYRLFRSCFLDYAVSNTASTGNSNNMNGLSGGMKSGGNSGGGGGGGGGGNSKVIVQFVWNDRKKYCDWILALCNILSKLQSSTNIHSQGNNSSSSGLGMTAPSNSSSPSLSRRTSQK